MVAAGQQLRIAREQLGLTVRDVEMASAAIAAKHANDDYAISLSRLSDIETKGIVPSVFRLYSLAVIYRCDLRTVLSWYGVHFNEVIADFNVVSPPKSSLPVPKAHICSCSIFPKFQCLTCFPTVASWLRMQSKTSRSPAFHASSSFSFLRVYA